MKLIIELHCEHEKPRDASCYYALVACFKGNKRWDCKGDEDCNSETVIKYNRIGPSLDKYKMYSSEKIGLRKIISLLSVRGAPTFI